MYKLLLSLVFVSASTVLGFWFSQKLSSRRKNLELIFQAVSKTSTLVGFSGYEITRVIKESFGKIQIFENIETFVEEGMSFNESFERCVVQMPSETSLNDEDKQLLIGFSKGLGVTDLSGQTSNCELYGKLFEERINDAKEKEKSLSRLYKILGFSLGCVVILMIV